MPLILTLWLDSESDEDFNQLRHEYFPNELNRVPAHVALFHNLPNQHLDSIASELTRLSEAQLSIPVLATGLRNLGRGVAFTLVSAELSSLRAHLARIWWDWLIPQDRKKFNPHITIQNKVTPEIAKATLIILQASWTTRVVGGIGLQLWEYRNGPWAHIRNFPFPNPRFITPP